MLTATSRGAVLLARGPFLKKCLAAPFSVSSLRNAEKAGESVEKKEGAPERPLYATRASYDREQSKQRQQSADMGSGQKPTPMQRRFLVLTRLYPSTAAIPEFVQHGTMDRMHDRMRVVFIAVGVVVFFAIFFYIEGKNARRIQRDRDAGTVVTKM